MARALDRSKIKHLEKKIEFTYEIQAAVFLKENINNMKTVSFDLMKITHET